MLAENSSREMKYRKRAQANALEFDKLASQPTAHQKDMSRKSKKRGTSNKGASLVKNKSKSTDVIPKSNNRIDTREVENMAPEQQSQKLSLEVEAISDPATTRKNKENSSKVIENDGVLLKRTRSSRQCEEPNLASRSSSLMPPSSTAAISPPRTTVSMNPQNEQRRKNPKRSTSTNVPSKEQIKRKGSARSIPTKKRSIATSGRASNHETADKPKRKNSEERTKLAHREQVKEKSGKQDYMGTGTQPTRSMSAPTPRTNADLNAAYRYQSASNRQQVSRTMSIGGKSIPSGSKHNSKPISSRSASYREAGGVLEKVTATVDRALEKIISVPESLYGSRRHDEKEQLECTAVIESDSIDSVRGGFEEVTPKTAQVSTVPQCDDHNDEEKAEGIIAPQECRSAETASIEMREEQSSFCAQCLVGIALLFDFATTVISWQAHEERSCCGTELVRETISTVITVALLSLIIIEGFALLLQLLVFKNARRGLRAHEEKRRQPDKYSFLQFFSNMQRLKIMTMLNPFFGFTISWILLSHAYRLQSLLVFSLQSCGLLLHLASSRLLGSFKTTKTGCFHLLPVVPFLVYGVLLLVFAGSGGICFLSDSKDYFFSGCEICPDGKPTINGVCGLEDGIVVTVTDPKPWEVKGGLFDAARAHPSPMGQGTYCASETQSGPVVSFCFFEY